MNVQIEQFKILLRNLRKKSEQKKLGIKKIDDSFTSGKESKKFLLQQEHKYNKK